MHRIEHVPPCLLRTAILVFVLACLAAPAMAQSGAAPLLRAAGQGDARAQSALAQAYLSGDLGLKEDHAEAARWARKAADQDNDDAQALLAGLYLDGDGVPKDEDKAAELLDRAMGRKNGMAFYLGARMARARTKVPDHDGRANLLLRIGAYLGNRASMAALGHVFETGEGVAPDPVQAYVWYGVAVLQFDQGSVPPPLRDAISVAAKRLGAAHEKTAKAIVTKCLNSKLIDCGAPQMPKELLP